MSEISAKLCSISFSKQKFQTGISKENWNLIKWIVSCAAMMTVCVPYVYIVPHIAVNPSNNHSLNHTIYDTFEVRILNVQENYRVLVWHKSVFSIPWLLILYVQKETTLCILLWFWVFVFKLKFKNLGLFEMKAYWAGKNWAHITK